MNKRIFVPMLAIGLLLPLAAQANTTSADYQAAYQQAMAVHQKVVAQNNQWTTTLDVLDAAEKAADQENYAEATDLATRAQHLAEAALEQVQHQKQVWKKAVIK